MGVCRGHLPNIGVYLAVFATHGALIPVEGGAFGL